MGFLKKLFKPVSKVLDKIIPNEIKPALPYLAAFAPMLAPTTGFMGSMMGRALLSGGANIGAQLAQEGNEGDINKLSALLAGGIGALSAPGAGDTLRGGTMANDPSMLTREGIMSQMSNAPMGANSLNQAQPFLGRTTDSALNFLAKGADKLQAVNAAGAADPFSMAGLKAAAIPFSQGTGDLMYQEGMNAQRDYEKALLDYENSLEDANLATDAGRRNAIIQAMTGNHTQEVIDETLAELGLRNGGRVGYAGGGITDIFAEESFSRPDFGGVTEAIGNIEQENELLANRQQDFYMLLEEAMNMGDEDKILEIQSDFYKEFGIPMPMSENTTEESVTQMAAEGGIMGYNMGGNVLPQGMEMDYRGGGFIPMGSKERADDVPARVSKNEFVMTADAVRAAGGGSVNQGAKKMYELMNNLEARA